MGRWEPVTGICSLVGGVAWTGACLAHNALPEGCIDQGCVDGTLRGSSGPDLALFVLAGAMLAVSGVGLLLAVHGARALGRVGVYAAVSGGVGVGLLCTASVVANFVDGDWPGMPALVGPGLGLLVVGIVLLARVVLRAKVLPRWAAGLLLATALLLPFANEQTSRILLAVPFGASWLTAGAVLLLGARRTWRAGTLA